MRTFVFYEMQMLKKGSKLSSILRGTCPKCQNTSMYLGKNPYKLSETLQLHDRCSHCNFKFHIEPSFFYGSMYVSYGLGILFASISFAIAYLIFNLGPLGSFISIVFTLLFLIPITARLSRNIWINLFVSYDKNLD